MRFLGSKEEIEKRYIVLNYHPSFISEKAKRIEIVQNYLRPTRRCKRRRVRKALCGGKTAYIYNEKYPLELGKKEKEWELTKKQYLKLLRGQADPERLAIEKTRYEDRFCGNTLEWDSHHHPLLKGLHILEVELSIEAFYQPIQFPGGVELHDITAYPSLKDKNNPYATRYMAKFLKEQERAGGRHLLEAHPPILKAVT